jgi:hypothetical protein
MTIRVIPLKNMQRSHLLTVSQSRSRRSIELLHQRPSAVTEGGPQFTLLRPQGEPYNRLKTTPALSRLRVLAARYNLGKQ